MINRPAAPANPFQMVFPSLLVTLLFCYLSPAHITATQAALAFVLLLIPWSSYLTWRSQKRRDVPLFAMIAGMNWIYFVQPLFWGDRQIPGLAIDAPQELITAVLAMTVAGVGCLWLGMQTPIELWSPARLPDLADSPGSWPYLRTVMAGGIAIGLWSGAPYTFGDGGRQVMLLTQTAVPSTVFAFFFRKYVRGQAQQIDKALILIFVATRVLVGLSSGWLGTIVWPGVICVLVYIAEGRRVPLKTALLICGCVLFLQIGKETFREVYWGGQEGTTAEKVQFWVGQSFSRWSGAINGEGQASARALTAETVSRLSLLTQAAHVMDWTPAVVPFQNGSTYSYMAITLIPRFLWPTKPSMSSANRFYQVAYGLTSEGNLGKVSISVGYLTEGYMNFGWWGAAGVSYLIGVFMGVFQRTFLNTRSGLLFGSLGLAMVPCFMILEWQLAQLLSGFLQQVGLVLLILLPVVKPRAARLTSRSTRYGPAQAPPARA